MGQSVGVCGGSVKLTKRNRETLEGTCVGLSIDIGRFMISSIKLDGSIELDCTDEMDGSNELLDARFLDLLKKCGVLSGDTLGDAGSVLDCCTLGA